MIVFIQTQWLHKQNSAYFNLLWLYICNNPVHNLAKWVSLLTIRKLAGSCEGTNVYSVDIGADKADWGLGVGGWAHLPFLTCILDLNTLLCFQIRDVTDSAVSINRTRATQHYKDFFNMMSHQPVSLSF